MFQSSPAVATGMSVIGSKIEHDGYVAFKSDRFRSRLLESCQISPGRDRLELFWLWATKSAFRLRFERDDQTFS